MFSVTAHDLIKDQEYSEEFDHVVVATGHFSTANTPYFDGIETFKGRLLHAHDLRDTQEFKDKDILLIGSSFSGKDIAVQCWKYGCKSVIISYETEPTGFKWPDNIREKPLLQKVDKYTCVFKDGSTADVDAIIMCTGYLHHFPFMEDKLKLRATNRLAVVNLYKGVVWVDNPKLFYLGMQDQAYTFTMFDAQAWYVRDIIMGRINVPECDVRVADVKERIAREDESHGRRHARVRSQTDYVKELIDSTDYPNFDVEGICQLFHQVFATARNDFTTYRNNCYKSVITDTMSLMNHTHWKDDFDDSVEGYLRN